MELRAEVVECADGVLNLLWEGNKLAGVSFDTRAPKRAPNQNSYNPLTYEWEFCAHCGTWLEKDDRGAWVDLNDRFLCRESPSSMHKVSS